MTQAVADVRLHSNLIDDYLYVEDAPVAPGPPGSFLAVREAPGQSDQPDPRSHVLAIDSSGDLLHFAPDATSASGWRVTTVRVPIPSGVTDGIFSTAAFFSAGTLNVLCHFPAPRSYPITPGGYAVNWMTRTSPGQWSQANFTSAALGMLSLCGQLDHYVDASGNAYVYGVVPPVLGQLQGGSAYLAPQSAVFFILYFDSTESNWDILYHTEVGNLNASAPVTFQILSGGSAAPTVLWVDGQNIQWQEANLSEDGFGWIGETSTLLFGSIVIDGIGRILRFPGTSSVDVVLILDLSGTLWLAQFLSGSDFPILIQLTGIHGAPAGAVSAGLTSDFTLFVVESGTNTLWLSRQYAGDTISWVNLGNHVEAIAVPSSGSSGLELFYVDLSDRLFHFSQNPSDTVWVTRKIAAPVPSTKPPTKAASIAMHAAALDLSGGPVANAIFTVDSDQWVNLIVDALSYWAGPGASTVFSADATGRATATFRATGLAMPKLTFSAVNPDGSATSGTAQRWCQGDVIEVKSGETAIPVSASSVASRLAGNDPLRPVNEQSLEDAGLLDKSFHGKSAAVSNITHIGQWMLAQGPASADAARDAPMTTRHWRFEFAPTGVTCRELTVPIPLSGDPGGIFSDIFGDVVNWAKHAVDEVISISISIGTTFEIAFNDAVSFTVSTVREAGEALEVVFVQIVQGIEDVITILKDIIEFLMLLFDWDDILHTHNVIRKMVTSLLGQVEASAEGLQTLLARQFSSLATTINAELATVGTNPDFAQSFNQFANGQPNPPGGTAASANVLDYPAGSDAFNQHLPRCLYVYSHAKNVSLSSALGAGSALVDISAIESAVTGSWHTGEMAAARTAFLNAIAGGGYGQLLDLGIDVFVTMMQDLVSLVLGGAEIVFGAILDTIVAVIAGFNAMFEATIDIPVISFVYNLLTGDDLSLLDLFCLLCAVPVTILYKVLNGGEAPFSAGDADSLNLPWPDPGQGALIGRRGPVGDSSIYQTLGICGGVMNLLNAFIAPVCDAMAFDSPEPGPLPLFITWTSNLAGLTSMGFQAPWQTWLAGRPTNSADIMTTVLWAVELFPVVCDSAFGLATGGLARFLTTIGPIFEGCCGIALLGTGIATGVVQVVEGKKHGYTGWDLANSVVPNLARPFRFLILDQDNPTTPVSMGSLMTIDIIVSVASAMTQLAATDEG